MSASIIPLYDILLYCKRSNPARAGKSYENTLPLREPRDHPRTCGEKRVVLQNLRQGRGSPPRMRGKGAGLSLSVQSLGITPAHAGKSAVLRIYAVWAWDHPRTCGEKGFFVCSLLRLLGSPPRMRGKEVDGKEIPAEDRITPAHAGKRFPKILPMYRCRDHPRTCGEKVSYRLSWLAPSGSPPHMRGKGFRMRLPGRRSGITPAHAGKRTCPRRSARRRKDHPCTCGEKSNRTPEISST